MDDINEETMYPIRWDTVIKYANVEADGIFTGYCLPVVPVPPPTDEVEIAGKKYV